MSSTYIHPQTGCLVCFPLPGDDGSSVTVQDRDGRHIGDFRDPRIGAVAAAYEWAHLGGSDSNSTTAIAAVEAALTERYAATMDPSLLAPAIRAAAGLD